MDIGLPEKMDYLIKTFMRIIFKGIYIQNKKIVKVEINEPWKMCYEEGLKMDPRVREDDSLGEGSKWQKKSETTPIQENPRTSRVMESVYFCAHSAEHWPRLLCVMEGVMAAVAGIDSRR